MKELPDLLRAIAALLWPIFAFVALILFKSQVRDLVNRLRKGKVFGQEIELRDALEQLEKGAEQASAAVEALPQGTPASRQSDAAGDFALEKQILGEAARSPKAALLLLASELERELRQLLASMGLLSEQRRPVTFKQGLDVLEARGGFPVHVASSARLFYDVRNRLVHGFQSSDNDILAAIDSGLTILRALRAIPHEINHVHDPGVPVYEDSSLTRPRTGVLGVVLETRSPGGARTDFRIYPSTRTDYQKGQRVSWEWNMTRVFDQSWYRDPQTGEVKEAWTSSTEFAGRDVNQL
jgi:hypothetical protein